MTRVGADEYVRLEGPGFRNGAAIAASLDDLRHEEAENVRLLYVALTRARDRLVVFDGGTRTAWSATLAAWTEGVTRRTVTDSMTARRTDLRSVVGAPDALARFEAAAGLTRTDAPFHSPSDLGDAVEPLAARPGALERDLARAAGRIVHARLAGLKTLDAEAGREEAESVLRLFEQSPLHERLAKLDVLGREVPMLLGDDGLLWHGTIDLLYRDNDGTIVVADYKTDASDEGAVARHGGQLDVYARAVRRALPQARVRAELWMLRTGRVLEV
jgi:ATP-dependent helicase/nuclease subunit A